MTPQQKSASNYFINLIGTVFSGLCVAGIALLMNITLDMHKDIATLKEWKSMNEERAKNNETQVSQLFGDYKKVNDRQDRAEQSINYLEAILSESLRRKKNS